MNVVLPFRVPAALTYANWSKLAYGGPIPSNVKFEWVVNDKADVHCLVIYQSDKTIFAFRGTTDIAEWIVDANIKFKKLDGGVKIHSGFYGTIDSIWPKLVAIASKSTVPIYTTGHSKGAAEARVFTYRLATEKKIFVKQSITFGEPRSFNKTGADKYNELNISTYRVIDDADMVCRVPWRLGLYWHVNSSAFIDSWNNITIGEPWYAHIPSDVYGIFMAFIHRHDVLVGDHNLDKYINELQLQLQ